MGQQRPNLDTCMMSYQKQFQPNWSMYVCVMAEQLNSNVVLFYNLFDKSTKLHVIILGVKLWHQPPALHSGEDPTFCTQDLVITGTTPLTS